LTPNQSNCVGEFAHLTRAAQLLHSLEERECGLEILCILFGHYAFNLLANGARIAVVFLFGRHVLALLVSLDGAQRPLDI
jgi:hypothetical protein